MSRDSKLSSSHRTRWVAGLLFLLLVSVAGYWHRTRSDPVDALIARARARGLPTSLEDLARLYPYKPQAHSNFLELAKIWEELNEQPSPPFSVHGWLSNQTNQPGAKLSPIPLEVAQWADENAPLVKRLVQKLNADADLDFGYQLATNGGPASKPIAGQQRAAAQLLTRSTLAFERSDSDSGVTELLGALRLMRYFRSSGPEYSLIELVYRSGHIRLTYAPVNAMLNGRQLTDSQLADLQKEASGFSELPDLSTSLRYEWARIMGSRKEILRSGSAAGPSNGLLSILNTVQILIGSDTADFAELARLTDARCDACTGTLTNRELRLKAVMDEYTPIAKKWNRPITRLGFSANIRDLSHRELAVTGWLRCVITSLALERFHLRHGRWPETLSALVPEFLPAAPLDPIDEQPLRYRVEPGGYAIYSLGLNGQDDGGLVKTVYSDQPTQNLEGDVGIRVNRPQR